MSSKFISIKTKIALLVGVGVFLIAGILISVSTYYSLSAAKKTSAKISYEMAFTYGNQVESKMEDAMAADEIFSVLMGDKVEPRRKFIEDNAHLVRNLDV